MMANWFAACFQVRCGIFQSFSILRKARNNNLLAAEEVAAILDDLSQTHMQAFDGVGRINNCAHFWRLGKEQNHLLTLAPPHGSHSREPGAPWSGCKRIERGFG